MAVGYGEEYVNRASTWNLPIHYNLSVQKYSQTVYNMTFHKPIFIYSNWMPITREYDVMFEAYIIPFYYAYA